MWKILLEEFIGDLKAQKMRAFLTMLAITWGTIAIVILMSFGGGLHDAFMRGTVNAGDRDEDPDPVNREQRGGVENAITQLGNLADVPEA